MRQVEWLKVKSLTGKIIEAKSTIDGETLIGLWRSLGFIVSYNDYDPQCGSTPEVFINNSSWRVWEKEHPEKVLLFVMDFSKELHLDIEIDERLQHRINLATAIIYLKKQHRSYKSPFRGDAECETMQEARFLALLKAFAKMLEAMPTHGLAQAV